MAWCQFLTGNHSAALGSINKAILIEANASESHYIRGRVLLAAERYEEASEAFERAILCDRRNVVYVVSLGIGTAMREKHKEAQKVLARAVRMNKNLPEVWFNLGLVYEAMQRYSDALAAYEEATKNDPSFYPAVVSKHALCINCVIPYSNSRFVHPQFHIPDSILPNKSLANSTKLWEFCEDYFKTVTNPQAPALISAVEPEPVEEHSESNKQKSNGVNEFSELNAQEEVQASKKLSSKPNGQENSGNAKPGQSDSNIHLQPQSSANPKPHSSPRVPASHKEPAPPYPTQPQIKICMPPRQSSTPVNRISVDSSQAETAQFLNRLLQSQQRQVHGMMNAYGLFSQPGNSQPQKPGEQPLIVRYANPAELPIQFLPAFTQNNITMHQPNVSLIGNFGSIPQLGAAGEKNADSPRELRHQTKKGISKQSREHILDKRKVPEEQEEVKESVLSPRPKIKTENSQDIEKNSSDMIVRLNMLIQKPNRKQRKHSEPSVEKEHKPNYKKTKHI
eukprot:TRINITY_DN7753_c0_g3_i3.p1 TRINITY_DN7753_c0_g3~~TRINITY_DN7753_c0_g3_i3.p1  ORF type:complete len:508 (-),score=77.04 TRINITY_DN7753_c0_g3_i3:57-1580(-)